MAMSLRPVDESTSGDLIIRPVAALGWRQAAALRGDGAALHAVRWRDLDVDALALEVVRQAAAVLLQAVLDLVRERVDLCRAHVLPHDGQLDWHVLLNADVVGR